MIGMPDAEADSIQEHFTNTGFITIILADMRGKVPAWKRNIYSNIKPGNDEHCAVMVDEKDHEERIPHICN